MRNVSEARILTRNVVELSNFKFAMWQDFTWSHELIGSSNIHSIPREANVAYT